MSAGSPALENELDSFPFSVVESANLFPILHSFPFKSVRKVTGHHKICNIIFNAANPGQGKIDNRHLVNIHTHAPHAPANSVPILGIAGFFSVVSQLFCGYVTSAAHAQCLQQSFTRSRGFWEGNPVQRRRMTMVWQCFMNWPMLIPWLLTQISTNCVAKNTRVTPSVCGQK